MKSQLSIVAVIAVAAVAALGVNAFANNGSISSSSSLSDSGFAIGHVEMILRDADGNIKNYVQGDNVVTNVGDSCVSELIFGDAGVSTCAGAVFNKIGIINGSYTLAEGSTMATAAAAGTGGNNIMAIVDAVATVPDTAGTQGTDSTIVNSGHLFRFVDNQNDTSVSGVILVDALCTESTVAGQEGSCATKPAAGEIFATRSTTLAVTGGDTLEVTWTITVGSSA